MEDVASTTESPGQMIARRIKELRLSECAAARLAGVHRNFLRDVLAGKYPAVRIGSLKATEDPRYSQLAAAFGLNVVEFCRQVTSIQSQDRSVLKENRQAFEVNEEGIVLRISRRAFPAIPIDLSCTYGDLIITVSVRRK